jgi:hypothetical protein
LKNTGWQGEEPTFARSVKSVEPQRWYALVTPIVYVKPEDNSQHFCKTLE